MFDTPSWTRRRKWCSTSSTTRGPLSHGLWLVLTRRDMGRGYKTDLGRPGPRRPDSRGFNRRNAVRLVARRRGCVRTAARNRLLREGERVNCKPRTRIVSPNPRGSAARVGQTQPDGLIRASHEASRYIYVEPPRETPGVPISRKHPVAADAGRLVRIKLHVRACGNAQNWPHASDQHPNVLVPGLRGSLFRLAPECTYGDRRTAKSDSAQAKVGSGTR